MLLDILLCDAQIDYDYIPQDVWSNQSYYGTDIEDNCLHINTQRYQVLIIPRAQFITKDLAYSLVGMQEKGVKVFFVGAYPEGICNEHMSREEQMLLEQIREYPVIQRDELVSTMQQEQCTDITLVPAHNRVRYYHYEHTDGTGVYLFCNEGTDPFDGCIHLSDSRHGYEYCAWNNTLTKARYNGAKLTMYLEPLKSYVLILDPEATHTNDTLVAIQPVRMIDKTHVIPLDRWERSVCRSKEYPEFGECVPIKLPDTLHELQPEFSGMVRYESSFIAQKGQKIAIEITDAHEGVEVFINQISLGIQIVPTFLFYTADELIDGSNALVIEVATTLERELAHIPDMMGVVRPAQGLSGLTGQVTLYLQE